MTIDMTALDKLLDVIGGETADLVELMQSFLEESVELVAAIRIGNAAGEIEAVKRASHSLKSSARDFGAFELAERCAALEADCRAGRAPWPADEITAIEQLYRAARLRLEQVMTSYQG